MTCYREADDTYYFEIRIEHELIKMISKLMALLHPDSTISWNEF